MIAKGFKYDDEGRRYKECRKCGGPQYKGPYNQLCPKCKVIKFQNELFLKTKNPKI